MAGPEGSPYEGGRFELDIKLPPRYPMEPPMVQFRTQIFHPNVDDRGGICLDVLKNMWSPALSLQKVLLSVSSLLTDPNFSDPLNSSASQLFKKDRVAYESKCKSMTMKFAMGPATGIKRSAAQAGLDATGSSAFGGSAPSRGAAPSSSSSRAKAKAKSVAISPKAKAAAPAATGSAAVAAPRPAAAAPKAATPKVAAPSSAAAKAAATKATAAAAAEARGKAAGKAKAKAKAGAAKKDAGATKSGAAKGGAAMVTDPKIEDVLRRWSVAKNKENEAHKEVEACKTKVEAELMKLGVDVLKTPSFEVTKRTQSRESCGKADLPADIWAQYAKTSSFQVLALKELGGKKK